MAREKAFEILDYEQVFHFKTVGPYGAAVKIKPGAQLIFMSGLVSRDPKTGEVAGRGDLRAQTINTMERIKYGLSAAGATMDDIYYLHLWLDENITPEDKEKIVDPAFGQYFQGRVPPCNVVMGIKRCFMPKGGANLEIEAWAAVMPDQK